MLSSLKKTALSGAVCVSLSFSSYASETLVPEIVAEWNSLPYSLSDPERRQNWLNSELHGKAPMQGLKIDSKGNMYVSTARWNGKDIPATVSKLVKSGDTYQLKPFPSEAFNDVDNPKGLKAVLGFEIDRNDVMWLLDQGHIAGQPSGNGDEKLILWDLRKNKEIQRYEFSDKDSNKTCSFLNDIVVDNDSGFAFITDSGIFCDPLHGGLIVYNRKTNTARRVLNQTLFTNDEPGFVFNVGGRPVLKDTPMRTGADGIALSGDKKTLYWTNLTGNRLYSVPTALLKDPDVSETELEHAVRLENILPSNTDGMTSDRDGNLFMTALTLDSLMYRDAETGNVSRYVHHPEMSWPDTLAWGPDGDLYWVSNHLNLWIDGDMNFKDPDVPNFRIWKLDLSRKSYQQP